MTQNQNVLLQKPRLEARYLPGTFSVLGVVASLYKEGLLKKPGNYPYPFPDLLAFHDASTTIEQPLFVMHLKHRMRLFQGSFHANPDYALWYGWSEMVRDLTAIKEKAEEIRKSKKVQ